MFVFFYKLDLIFLFVVTAFPKKHLWQTFLNSNILNKCVEIYDLQFEVQFHQLMICDLSFIFAFNVDFNFVGIFSVFAILSYTISFIFCPVLVIFTVILSFHLFSLSFLLIFDRVISFCILVRIGTISRNFLLHASVGKF